MLLVYINATLTYISKVTRACPRGLAIPIGECETRHHYARKYLLTKSLYMVTTEL